MEKTLNHLKFNKKTSIENPYAVYVNYKTNTEYRVLIIEDNKWYVAIKTPFDISSYELSEELPSLIINNCALIECTKEWVNYYAN